MAFPLLLLLVGVVSGQRTQVVQRGPGDSLTVHCDYKDDFKDNRKTWCRETEPDECDLDVTTGLSGAQLVNATLGRTHISDNKRTQQISVTIQKLRESDAGVYWCGVDLSRTNTVEIIKKIDLRISEGQGAEVEQRGPGESLTVRCPYTDGYKDHRKIWCRETEPGICTHVVRTPWSAAKLVNATSGRTHISDNKITQQISVTIQKLEEPDAGVYWCGVHFSPSNTVLTVKKIDLRISEGFTRSPETKLTDSRDESQEEDMTESGENSSFSELYIILITVGLGFLFLLTVIALFYIRWARKRKNEQLIEPSDGHRSPGLEASMKGTSVEENPGTIPSELNSQEMKYATLTLHAPREQGEATYSNVGLGSKHPASAGRYNPEYVEYASINLQTLQGRGDALQ